ncbi:MAG: alpha-mannosidase [Clostridium sp.]
MFFTVNKIDSRIEELEWVRYYKMENAFPFKAYNDIRSKDEVVQAPPQKGDEFEVINNSLLVGRDRYTWLEKNVKLPSKMENFDIVGRFDFGKTGGGNNSGFESLLYVDGVEYQGVDSNHREVFFKDDLGDKEIEMQFLLWSGLNGGGAPKDELMLLKQAEIGYIHTQTDEFYYLAKNMNNAIKRMQEGSPIKHKLISLLDNIITKLSFSDVENNREDFYKLVEKEYPIFLENLEKMGKDSDITVYCVGHTHIDVAWLWRVKHTKEKCLRSFSSVLRLMDKYPEYIFMQGQPQLYKFVKENYPDFYERMKEEIKSGRFEPNGGMWVEADCNISSGEALVRQFLYGIRFFDKEFGIKSTCLWLPDVFGYSWALPQIMKGFNLDTFMTTKISWNEYNKIPHDTFKWRGMDGSEILTHFITTPDEGDGPDHYQYFTYNGQVDAETVTGIYDNYVDKALNQDLLISYGYGDGGGGPNREMIMNRQALDKIPGIPHVKETTVKDYFKRLHENVENSNDYMHTWASELYFENHRGTYTSQAYNKLMNRKLEIYTAHMETMYVLSELLGGVEIPKESFDKIWELILVNQFHDIIPGSSITEVYEDSRKDYTFCEKELNRIKDEYSKVISDGCDNKYTFFNYTPFSREEVVFIGEERVGTFKDNEGVELISEKVSGGYKVHLKLLPTGFTTIEFVEDFERIESNSFSVDMDSRVIETPIYSVAFDSKGMISRIFDKENNREVLKEFGNRLTVHQDYPIEFDAWNVDIDHLYHYEVVENLLKFEVISIGELELELGVSYKYNNSLISQTIKFYSFDRKIEFDTNVDWHENHKFLKVGFDANVFSNVATYDIQFGNIQRSTHFSSSWDYAKFEVVAHKWVDLSETGYGVALLNDCKYGHSVKDSLMSISLIKCATWPDPKADQGKHSFKYAILPHKGTWQESGVQAHGENFNNRLHMFKGDSPLCNKSLFKISSNNISIDAIKASEEGDGIILRVHEFMGMRNSFEITSDFNISWYEEVNLLEESLGYGISSDKIEGYITPYQIRTYKIKIEKN